MSYKMQKIKVYAIPCAGGTSMLFNEIAKQNNDNVEIVPIELAGHGKRIGEPFYNDIYDAVEDVYSIICDDIENEVFAIIGYSMGGLLAYEVCRLLEKRGKKLPIRLFIASMGTPENRSVFSKVGNYNDEELLRFVVELGGVTKDLIRDSTFNKVFFPIIKKDFVLLSRYKIPIVNRIDTSITVFYGEDDFTVEKKMQGWKQYTNKEFDVISYKGGHFFIYNNSEQLFNAICKRLPYVWGGKEEPYVW